MPKNTKTNTVSKDVKKYVRKQLQAVLEIKRKEYDGFGSSATNTGWVLAYPAQGTTSEERTGDAIVMKHFSMIFNIYALTTLSTTRRVIVFQSDAASILSAANLFVGGPGNYLQGHVDDNYVTVLYDEIFQLDGASALSHAVQKKIKMNKKITFLLGTQTPKEEYIHIWLGSCDAAGIPQNGLSYLVANFQIGYTDA